MNLVGQDTFTGANGTLITDRSPDLGPGWTNMSGTTEINNNRARTVSGFSRAAMVYDTAPGDQIVEATMRFVGSTGSANGGVEARVNGSNRLVLQLQPASSLLVLRRVISGSVTLDDYSVTISADTDYVLRMEVTGTTVNGYLDDVLRVTGDTSTLLTGHPGLALSFNNLEIDNWSAQADIEIGGGGGLWLPKPEFLGPDSPIIPGYRR